jgi:hypothetical protein
MKEDDFSVPGRNPKADCSLCPILLVPGSPSGWEAGAQSRKTEDSQNGKRTPSKPGQLHFFEH